MKKEIVIIFLLFVISIPALKSLFIPGGFTAHDLTHHVIRQISMDRLLSEGQFPPRWSGELNNGYGYPLFLFNYPLPVLLGQVFHILGFGYLYSVKAVFLTSMILSILGMYLFLRSYLGSELGSFLGAVFYLYAPIRFINVYVSGAVGAALGAALVPFVFWGLVKIKQTQKMGWVLLSSLFFVCLILAHNVTALIFLPLIGMFVLLLILQSKQKKALTKRFLLMFILGFSLSIWFWLPALWEKQYIRFDQLFKGFYENQFPTIWGLLRSPWGYGLSHPQNYEPGSMSHQLGLIHILVMIMLLPTVWVLRKVKEVRVIGGSVLLVLFLSLFFILEISKPFWEIIPLLGSIQFPWRLSAIFIFASSIAAALLVKYSRPLLKWFIFTALLVLVIYANRNHWNINQVYDPGESYYLSLKATSSSDDEHLPKWGRTMKKPALSKIETLEGGVKVNITQNKSIKILAEVEASQSSKLRLNQFYFPGWHILIDGKQTQFNYLSDTESYGLPIFDVEIGKHTVLAEFKNTTVRNLAESISLISVILWIGLICKLLMSSLLKVKKSS